MRRLVIELWRRAVYAFGQRLIERECRRNQGRPDQVIGEDYSPYLWRWYVTPWSGWYRKVPRSERTWWMRLMTALPSIYLHCFHRSDDDRAHHDHPWCNASLLLSGRYTEHTIAAGGINVRRQRVTGDMAFRRAKGAHRIELTDGVCWSLFFTGFRLREWGFHCPEQGWVHWTDFTADNGQTIGKGCDQ